MEKRAFRKFEWSVWKLLDCRILHQIPKGFWEPWAAPKRPAVLNEPPSENFCLRAWVIHLIISSMFYQGEGVDFFTMKLLTFQCVICSEVSNFFFKYMYICFQDLFNLSNKQHQRLIYFVGRQNRPSGEEKITHVCVCVCRGWGVTCNLFYSP